MDAGLKSPDLAFEPKLVAPRSGRRICLQIHRNTDNMDHKPINLESTGAFLRITPDNQQAYWLAAKLIGILHPPIGAPFADEIVRLLSNAVTYTVDKLVGPTPEAIQIKDKFHALMEVMDNAKNDIASGSSRLSLKGKANSNPVWYQLSMSAEIVSPTKPLLLYIGSSLLLSIHHQKAISRGAAPHIHQISTIDLSDASLDSLIAGFAPQEFLGSGWTSKLAKMWREVIKVYSNGDIPPPSLQSKITGQLLGAALNSSPSHAAGGQSHSQLSDRQFNVSASYIKDLISRDKLAGILGVIAVRTGLQVDLIGELPLQSGSRPGIGGFIDPTKGILWIDLKPLVFEPAQPLHGCHRSGILLPIHLPSDAALNLKCRAQQFSSASCLMDLYPGEVEVFTKENLYPSTEEICSTWARLRRSTGAFLLNKNFNALHAALLSLDFSLICRSKMHYSIVTANEWHEAESKLYRLLGWASPVDSISDEPGVGSMVVPTDDSIKEHDLALIQAMESNLPGKHASLERLINFHNSYTLLTAWRLIILLALRASREIALPASIGMESNWVAAHDKHTRSDRGHQPVPLSRFAIETIRLYRAHCDGMHDRLVNLQLGNQPTARWCQAVALGKNQRLLCTLTLRGEVHALSTHLFCKPLSSNYALPDDPGRKVMENALRADGLPSFLIDQMLRHSHAGHIHLSNFNPSPLSTSMKRLIEAIQRVAERLFSAPVAGLRKE